MGAEYISAHEGATIDSSTSFSKALEQRIIDTRNNNVDNIDFKSNIDYIPILKDGVIQFTNLIDTLIVKKPSDTVIPEVGRFYLDTDNNKLYYIKSIEDANNKIYSEISASDAFSVLQTGENDQTQTIVASKKYDILKIKPNADISISLKDKTENEPASLNIDYIRNYDNIIEEGSVSKNAPTVKAVLDYIKFNQAGGAVKLDEGSKIPSQFLPGYVDDIDEFDTLEAFPEAGQSEKLYLALDTNKIYRWSGSAYIEVSSQISLGETSSTAYQGDKGAANRQDIDNIIKGETSVGKANEANNATTINHLTVETAVPKGIDFNRLEIASESNPIGTITKEDKVKLNGIQEGANKYILPVANINNFGGIKAPPKKDLMKQQVGIDSDGTLWANNEIAISNSAPTQESIWIDPNGEEFNEIDSEGNYIIKGSLYTNNQKTQDNRVVTGGYKIIKATTPPTKVEPNTITFVVKGGKHG